MSQLSTPLRGIIPPMVTPLLDRDTLDCDACERLAERMIAAGVSGIFILGTTGEAPSLSYRVRRQMIEVLCRIVNGRAPILVSITDTAVVETLELAQHAARVGAAGLVLAPPYYFETSQSELLSYLVRLTPELPLPLYLYNIPSHTKTNFGVETVLAAAALPNVRGIKDSSGDMHYFAALAAALTPSPDFTLLCGPEELLVQTLYMGAHGGIAGGANLSPHLYVQLYRAAVNQDAARVAQLQAIVMEISNRIYHAVPGASGYLRGMKCALSELGLGSDVMAEPYQPLSSQESLSVRSAIREIDERIKSI